MIYLNQVTIIFRSLYTRVFTPPFGKRQPLPVISLHQGIRGASARTEGEANCSNSSQVAEVKQLAFLSAVTRMERIRNEHQRRRAFECRGDEGSEVRRRREAARSDGGASDKRRGARVSSSMKGAAVGAAGWRLLNGRSKKKCRSAGKD